MALCLIGCAPLYDHKLWDPKNVLLIDLTISFLCVYLKSHGRLGLGSGRAKASKRKEKRRAAQKSGPFGRGAGGPTTMASATRWHHWPLWVQLLPGSRNPWSPDPTPPQEGQSFPRGLCPEPLGPASVGVTTASP